MIDSESDTWTPVCAGSHVVYKSESADGQAGGRAREQACEHVGGRAGEQTSQRACEPASEQTDRWRAHKQAGNAAASQRPAFNRNVRLPRCHGTAVNW